MQKATQKVAFLFLALQYKSLYQDINLLMFANES